MLPSSREDLLAGDQIEIRLPIVFLDQRRRVRPPHAEVQRNVLRQFEVVLREQRDPILQVRPGIFRITAASSLAGNLIEQEVGECHAGEQAAVIEEAEQAVVAGVEPALVVAEELAAELQGVPPPQPGQLLVDLVGLRQRVRVGRDRPGQRQGQLRPLNVDEPGDRLAAGNPVECVAIAEAGPVERSPTSRLCG